MAKASVSVIILTMKKIVDPVKRAGNKEPDYKPGVQGRFISNAELVAWWHACEVDGLPPCLESGDRWFVDAPMMWEASGKTVLTRHLHLLPPQMWHRLN